MYLQVNTCRFAFCRLAFRHSVKTAISFKKMKILNEEVANILRQKKNAKESVKLFCEFLSQKDAEPSDFVSLWKTKVAKKALKYGFKFLSTDEQCLLYVSYMDMMGVETGVIDSMAYFFGVAE